MTTNPGLFNVSGNHVNEGDQVEVDMDIDIEKVSLYSCDHLTSNIEHMSTY